MKKTILLSILVLAASSFTFGQTFTPASIDVYKTNQPVTIDGKADEAVWSSPSVAWQTCAINLGGIDPAGYAAKFKAVYDADNLYLFFSVTDATFVPYNGTESQYYNADNIELYFDATGVRKPIENPNYDVTTGSQLRVNPGVTTIANLASGRGYVTSFIYQNTITGFQYSTVQVDGGYNVEVVVPWEIIIPDAYVGNIADGQKIIFDCCAANCTSPTSGRVNMQSWSCIDYNAWKQSVYYGDMNFKGLAVINGVKNTKVSNVTYSIQNKHLQLFNVENNSQLQIFNQSGQLVKSLKYNGSTIDLTDISSDLYFVRVNNENSFKIINR